MTHSILSRRGSVPLAALGVWISLVTASPALAQSELAPSVTQWRVRGDFAKSVAARENISGAACAPTNPPFASCLAVNDEKKYAQFFSIAGSTLVPGRVIRLLGDDADSDPDAEAAAYADGYFYIAGSHGLSRYKGALRLSSFLVFRFKVDAATGRPLFPVTDAKVDPAIEKSGKLRAALKSAPQIGPFAERPLKDNGLNIEGIAVRGQRIYLGLRAPSIGGKAFILSAALDGVFANAPLDARTHDLALGRETGIRDLATAKDGLLVLAGPVQSSGPYSIWFWDEREAPKRLAVLDLTSVRKGAKAETVLVLEEKPENYRVLVMFDGIANGGPLEFNVPR